MNNFTLHKISVVPSLTTKHKDTKQIKKIPQNIFYPINDFKNDFNLKYMMNKFQFVNQHGPILTFFAQFDDRNESPRDQMKFRNCNILFFVEDGTIKVYEPLQRNSGFNQGLLINKGKIPKPEGGFYELEDLNIGKTLIMYGKRFKILDCDPFTKNYLTEMGYRVRTPEPGVVDPVYADRQEVDKHRTSIQKPQYKEYKLAKFLKTHPKRLHFSVIYNYKPSRFEEIRYASLYYDLVENTIKIVDEKKLQEYQKQLCNGNYDTCVILKPTRVPKNQINSNLYNWDSRPLILNLNATSRKKTLEDLMNTRFGGFINPLGFMRDSNPNTRALHNESIYAAKDFDLGKTLNIFGYEVYFYDCDEFTKEFYRNEYNRELVPVPLPEINGTKYHVLVHKKNFGNREDSLKTCKELPSVNMPQKLIDLYKLSERPSHTGSHSDKLLKFLHNCRTGVGGKILTFLSRVTTNDAYLKNQFFVVQWFLEDDTVEISVLDLNSGSPISSKFGCLKRRKLTKPYSNHENAGTCYYTKKDIFIGNVIYAMGNPYLLIDADDYTLDYMERNCDFFSHADIRLIMKELFPLLRSKINDVKTSFDKHDLEKKQTINYDDFKSVVTRLIPEDARHNFPEHKIKTLARYFALDDDVGLKIGQLISKIQTDLKRQKFEEFDKLMNLFKFFDIDNDGHKGSFKPARVYDILRSYPLSIDRDLMKSLVFKFPKYNGLISFEELVNSLNYIKNPTEPPDNTPYAININWERKESVRNLNKISFSCFLKELTKEKCPNCV